MCGERESGGRRNEKVVNKRSWKIEEQKMLQAEEICFVNPWCDGHCISSLWLSNKLCLYLEARNNNNNKDSFRASRIQACTGWVLWLQGLTMLQLSWAGLQSFVSWMSKEFTFKVINMVLTKFQSLIICWSKSLSSSLIHLAVDQKKLLPCYLCLSIEHLIVW